VERRRRDRPTGQRGAVSALSSATEPQVVCGPVRFNLASRCNVYRIALHLRDTQLQAGIEFSQDPLGGKANAGARVLPCLRARVLVARLSVEESRRGGGRDRRRWSTKIEVGCTAQWICVGGVVAAECGTNRRSPFRSRRRRRFSLGWDFRVRLIRFGGWAAGKTECDTEYRLGGRGGWQYCAWKGGFPFSCVHAT